MRMIISTALILTVFAYAEPKNGELYCPAPKAGTTNERVVQLWEKLRGCQEKNLCLSYDGSRCEEPITWGEGLPEPQRPRPPRLPLTFINAVSSCSFLPSLHACEQCSTMLEGRTLNFLKQRGALHSRVSNWSFSPIEVDSVTVGFDFANAFPSWWPVSDPLETLNVTRSVSAFDSTLSLIVSV